MPCFEPVEVPAIDYMARELNDYCQLACLDPCVGVRRNVSGGTDPPGVDVPCGSGSWPNTISANVTGFIPGPGDCNLLNLNHKLILSPGTYITCGGDGPTHLEPIKWIIDPFFDNFTYAALIATPTASNIIVDFYLYECYGIGEQAGFYHWRSPAVSLGSCDLVGTVLSYIESDGVCSVFAITTIVTLA